ncbi:MAG: FecR family protein [Halanaerobiaceae bacterium]
MRNKAAIIFCFIFLFLFMTGPVETAEYVRIGRIEGEVQREVVNILGLEGWQGLDTSDGIEAGDRLRTGEGARMELVFENTVLLLDPETELVIEEGVETDAGRRPRVKVEKGRIWTRVKKIWQDLTSFEAVTPSAVAGVRGTVFSLHVKDGTLLSVQEGTVRLENKERTEEIDVSAGKMARIKKDSVEPSKKIDRAEKRKWEKETIKKWLKAKNGGQEELPPPSQGHPGDENGKDKSEAAPKKGQKEEEAEEKPGEQKEDEEENKKEGEDENAKQEENEKEEKPGQ